MVVSIIIPITEISVFISLMSDELMTLISEIQQSKAELFYEVCDEYAVRMS